MVQLLHYTGHMPTIHRQGNWKIVMYFGDHGIRHFHILTPDAQAKVAIDTLEVIAGNVDRKTLSAAQAWAAANRAMLRCRWQELSEAE